jgi:hypothetical protein
MGDQQVEDRFGLLAPKLVVKGRSGRRLLDRHAGFQIVGRGRGPPIVARASLGSPVPVAFPAAGSQALLQKREQICSMK